MIRSTLIDFNPVELKYYPFTVSLDKCSWSCNAGNDLFTKICLLSKTKHIIVKALNIITRIKEAKTLIKHISFDCKCQINSTICNSNQKQNNKTCQYEYKNYHKCKKDSRWNPTTCTCENSRHLKSIADISVNVCDETIIGMDILSNKCS